MLNFRSSAILRYCTLNSRAALGWPIRLLRPIPLIADHPSLRIEQRAVIAATVAPDRLAGAGESLVSPGAITPVTGCRCAPRRLHSIQPLRSTGSLPTFFSRRMQYAPSARLLIVTIATGAFGALARSGFDAQPRPDAGAPWPAAPAGAWTPLHVVGDQRPPELTASIQRCACGLGLPRRGLLCTTGHSGSSRSRKWRTSLS
jgi:hypothetical protein